MSFTRAELTAMLNALPEDEREEYAILVSVESGSVPSGYDLVAEVQNIFDVATAGAGYGVKVESVERAS